MWRTGTDHEHEDRVRQSKVSNSENRAELYLSYKDHKKEPGKTRPIATGCTSNTLALSNSTSDLVESLANLEETKHEIISTEDLFFNIKKHDVEIGILRREYKRKYLRKLRCTKCWIKREISKDGGGLLRVQGAGPLPAGSLGLNSQEPTGEEGEEKDKGGEAEVPPLVHPTLTPGPDQADPLVQGNTLIQERGRVS